jgi:hypothetical protein
MPPIAKWPKWGDLAGQLSASLFWATAVVVHDDYTPDMVFQLLAASSWTVACVFQIYVLLGFMEPHPSMPLERAATELVEPVALLVATQSQQPSFRLRL